MRGHMVEVQNPNGSWSDRAFGTNLGAAEDWAADYLLGAGIAHDDLDANLRILPAYCVHDGRTHHVFALQ